MEKNRSLISFVLGIVLAPAAALSQSSWNPNTIDIPHYPQAEQLSRDIRALCDIECARQGRDSSGENSSTRYILGAMSKAKLHPVNGSSYTQSFQLENGEKGCNVVGMLDGFRRIGKRKYIIVGAHYDNFGLLDGKFYPGADSNASGVAAMLGIAATFRGQRSDYHFYDGNVIFVAFDRYLDGRAGSKAFWEALERGEFTDPAGQNAITPDRIIAMIDIDQIGCTLSPVDKGVENYIIAIGEDSFPERKKGILERCNDYYGSSLKIYDSYYGSKRFTKAFYTLGDRRFFIEAGIPTMFFTSGITDNSNRTSDTPDTIDFEMLRRRTMLIFRFIEKIF